MTYSKPSGPSYSVWVVEDDQTTRKLFPEVVRSRGHVVREFEDAETAIEAFYATPP